MILAHVLSPAVRFQETRPYKGEVVQFSTTFKKGQFALPADVKGDETDPKVVVAAESPVILIKGNGLTVDFTGCELLGDTPTTPPDQRKGIAVVVEGNNDTIIGLRVKGYKIGLLAKGCKNLQLLKCDLSDNWKQHLLSTPDKEDLADWQFYHHNEDHEWFRYGAGIYLDDCTGFLVKDCTVKRGQCGLLIYKGTNGTVINCDFSFDSGLGIGMYRSSLNRITNNKMDWDARGYSWNNYYRGQDSASILMFEQCNKNLVAFNSMTEGGDGIFLWAGFQTMDSGEGGCNDNVFAYNDVSSAITNGMEATFSRNTFVGNLALQCWHGLWGGYSFDSVIKGNIFGFSDQGIAIEHGTNNVIDQNAFVGCRTGIALWADPPNGLSATYLAKRPSLSTQYQITNNTFNNCTAQPVNIKNTTEVTASNNAVSSFTGGTLEHWVSADVASTGLVQSNNTFNHSVLVPISLDLKQFLEGSTEYSGDIAAEVTALGWDPLRQMLPLMAVADPTRLGQNVTPPAGGQDPFLGGYRWRGRRYLMIGQWGPYDFEQPRLMFLGRAPGSGYFKFLTLGPKGRFVVKSVTGGEIKSAAYGVIGNTIEIKPNAGAFQDVAVSAVFTGEESRDEYGNPIPAGKRVEFQDHQMDSSMPWKVWYFQYDANSDPLANPDGFAKLLKSAPVDMQDETRIHYVSHDDWSGKVRADHYAMVAQTDPVLDAGIYHLDLICDDGAKVYIDGQMVPMYCEDGKPANSFRYQGATEYHANVKLNKGKHKIEVIYFQIDGGRALEFTITPPSKV